MHLFNLTTAGSACTRPACKTARLPLCGTVTVAYRRVVAQLQGDPLLQLIVITRPISATRRVVLVILHRIRVFKRVILPCSSFESSVRSKEDICLRICVQRICSR